MTREIKPESRDEQHPAMRHGGKKDALVHARGSRNSVTAMQVEVFRQISAAGKGEITLRDPKK